MHNFYFGDKWLSYFGGRIAQAPQHEIPVRDVSAVEIPYRDGDILIDNGRWQNIEFEREICFLPYLSELSAKHLARAVIEWLTLNQGYQKYKDTYNPGYFTEAYISNVDYIVRELPSLLSTRIKFNRKPWWHSELGQRTIDFELNKSVVLHNSERYESLPTIRITNTQNSSVRKVAVATVNINGDIFHFKCPGGYDHSIFDGETLQYIAYKSDGTTDFVNDEIMPPKLKTGNNQIIVTSYLNAIMSLRPNWRRL